MLSAAAVLQVGCGYGGVPTGFVPVAGQSDNWELTTTKTMGSDSATLKRLGGSIVIASGSSSQEARAVLQGTSSCFIGNEVFPMAGSFTNQTLTLRSFRIDNQYLGLTGKFDDSTQQTLTGTYMIDSGCANGESGSFAGVRYAALTGGYSGPLTGASALTVTLQVTQDTDPTGLGTFLLTGTAGLGGSSCFSKGTVQDGSISGSQFSLAMKTDEAAGSTLLLAGTIDAKAQAMTVASAVVNGGACSGSYGTGTLNRVSG